jgi:hypothetical protein
MNKNAFVITILKIIKKYMIFQFHICDWCIWNNENKENKIEFSFYVFQLWFQIRTNQIY